MWHQSYIVPQITGPKNLLDFAKGIGNVGMTIITQDNKHAFRNEAYSNSLPNQSPLLPTDIIRARENYYRNKTNNNMNNINNMNSN